ncbi:MAG: type 1 glutamine amidotransferase [Desulfovibrio sp.]|uniref:type 1 glutamine amidotransferase n=1 Tax=Desulfovibrio sp. 7SRBS1 TaxID=3378064 RepID=UPI003B3EF4FF
MRVNVLQHVPFENEALIGEWAKERGHDLSRTLCWEGGRELRPEDFDLLVIMGGPMSVTDADRYPFLLWEKQLIKMAVARGKKVLGICLGAQLIADALGGEVDRSSEREIGVFPVQLAPDARRASAMSGFPETFDAMHWHGDMVALPPRGAIVVASTPGCPVQGFSLGETCVGLQFHLECTPESIERLLENCADDLRPGTYVQDVETLRRNVSALQGRELLFGLLDRLVQD